MAWNSEVRVDALPSKTVDRAVGAFMASVYRWMFGGLLLTGVVAFYVASDYELLNRVGRNFYPLIFVELGLVIALTFLLPRISAGVAAAMFLAYAAVNGVTMSILFAIYQLGSVGQAFVLTGAVFGAMSVFATVTKKDLSAWRTFLVMGLVGIIAAGLLNLFIRSEAMSFVSSCAAVLVFSGLTAYDTQKLRQMAFAGGGEQTMAVRGALMLYLDFINLFLNLLRLFGRRR